jgi:hypothetical protein
MEQSALQAFHVMAKPSGSDCDQTITERKEL